MVNVSPRFRPASRADGCADPLVGAILAGWRYDLSGLSPLVRGEYETHMAACAQCQRRQQMHRTVDLLLMAATTLSFTAFLLAALVMHRLEAITHVGALRVHMHALLAQHGVPTVVTVSLEAVALAGVFVSMLLWVLVAIMTPVPSLVGGFLRQRFPRLAHKQEA